MVNDDAGILEILDTYMDMVEKQEEVIYRLSKIIQRQAHEIEHMKNVYGFTDEKSGDILEEEALAAESVNQYEQMKQGNY